MKDQRACSRAAVAGCKIIAIAMLFAGGCGPASSAPTEDIPADAATADGRFGGDPVVPTKFEIKLVASGATGSQRINFAIPFAPGALADEANIRLLAGDTELAAARRVLARHADGSPRSVQIQL